MYIFRDNEIANAQDESQKMDAEDKTNDKTDDNTLSVSDLVEDTFDTVYLKKELARYLKENDICDKVFCRDTLKVKYDFYVNFKRNTANWKKLKTKMKIIYLKIAFCLLDDPINPMDYTIAPKTKTLLDIFRVLVDFSGAKVTEFVSEQFNISAEEFQKVMVGCDWYYELDLTSISHLKRVFSWVEERLREYNFLESSKCNLEDNGNF